ncbi:enoyl-CoA hydratase/isomerase family protein [Polaromonas eurypsychrophila]|uniref:Enoyl-CoA hydratase n=1 Tax=Polaromonas eurypsychrophila TaxID=1614635 RepID=A0A916SDN7_9BURK|nr:enoyl-CoA hydratase-related protein [Polaromonas eurypsychrophila]GGA94835.1 enoyl-CoA hydratase [Polaromonas eurypsychrophila]
MDGTLTGKLLINRTGEVESWTLSDPATRNALTDELVAALRHACERAAADPGLRFVVLQGSGSAFCAGGSLGGFTASIGQALPVGQADPLIAMNAGFGALLEALCALPKMLLVAVDGPAMGGGLGLVCCADFVLAAPTAVFAAPEVTLGVVPAQIAAFVHRRLGDRAARRLLLTGEKLSADQALALGLADEVVADLQAAVAQRIGILRRAAPGAVAHTKALLCMLNTAAAHDLSAKAAIKFVANLRSPEAAEGLSAFAGKRKPGWAA